MQLCSGHANLTLHAVTVFSRSAPTLELLPITVSHKVIRDSVIFPQLQPRGPCFFAAFHGTTDRCGERKTIDVAITGNVRVPVVGWPIVELFVRD